jgi:hypothetical protein
VNRQILILMAKPLPRWQFMLGKWLGIVVFDMILLVIAGAGICGMVRFIAMSVPARDELDRRKLDNEILTARHRVQAEVPADMFKRVAEAEFERRREEGLYADITELSPDRAKEDLRRQVEADWRSIAPITFRVLQFDNVLCDRSPDRTIQIRYKAVATQPPPDEIIRSRWVVGDPEKVAPAVVLRRDVHDRFHTFSVPADTVAEDRTLMIRLDNVNPYADDPAYPRDPPNSVYSLPVIRLDDQAGVEVLFAVGTFEGNLIRVLALILFKLMFLAALGLLATSVFSFPVACMVSLTVYVLAGARGFVAEALEYLGDEGAVQVFQLVFGLVLRVVLFVIPDFPRYDAVDVFVDGRNVTLLWVLQGFGRLAVIQTGVLLLLACLLFHRREVSEVSV